jgi:5-formyltetrahydrofolate cyclo-ligase
MMRCCHSRRSYAGLGEGRGVSDFAQLSKGQIRQKILAARRARDDLTNADAEVRAILGSLVRGHGTVACYVPLAGEPGWAPLVLGPGGGPANPARCGSRAGPPDPAGSDPTGSRAGPPDPAGSDPTGSRAGPPDPAGSEPGDRPLGLPDTLAGKCGRLLLPIVLADLDLDWAVYLGELRPASRGLREPAGPVLGRDAIRDASLVIVPALAVDRRGIRLGRGGGSYDRALRRVTPGTPVVAALYDGELVDALPADPHDQRVTAVIMPSHGLVPLPA